MGRPFTVGIDVERGRVQRLTEILGRYPSARSLGRRGPDEVCATAREMGGKLAAHGITVNFAPVLDIGGAGLGIIGDRAFARGLTDADVTPTFKHFPGHGRASGDTHHGPAATPPLAELREKNLAPYAEVPPHFPEVQVMVGHMVVPGLGDAPLPASINPATYALLRGEFGFNGVAITDDLSGMDAIAAAMPIQEAAEAAVAAGADQALWKSGQFITETIDAVLAAIESGEIDRAAVEASYGRITR